MAECLIYLREADAFFDLLQIVVAFIGVIILLLTIREMQRQRQESYKPRLVFENRKFWLQQNDNGTPCLIKSSPDLDKSFYGEDYKLTLRNIGLGAAHSITITLICDEQEIIAEFTKYIDRTNRLIFNGVDHFQFLFDTTRSDGYGFFIRNTDSVGLSHLVSDKTYEFRIPSIMKDYITFGTYLELSAQNFPEK